MDWTAKRPNVEIAAEWIAACSLGGAIAFAVAALSQVEIVAALALGFAAAAAALLGLNRLGAPRASSAAAFAPVDFPEEGGGDGDEDVFPLDEPYALAELLLDDPLPAPVESRVVRLFTAAPSAIEAAAVIPPPGEMLARIENFLGATRDDTAVPVPIATVPTGRDSAASTDANAALHAALADIRRSLRQG